MNTNIELQRDVLDELLYEPSVDPAEIGITAKDGIQTLSGKVNSYAENGLLSEQRNASAECELLWMR